MFCRFLQMLFLCLLLNVATVSGITNHTAVTRALFINESVRLDCNILNVSYVVWSYVNRSHTGAHVPISSGERVVRKFRDTYQIKVTPHADQSHSVLSLSFIAKSELSGSRFRCQERGEVRNDILLLVEDLPTIWLGHNNKKITGTAPVVFFADNEYQLRCVVVTHDPTIELSWKRNNIDQFTNNTDRYNAAHGWYSILNFKPLIEDQNITCSACRDTGEAIVNVYVELQIVPSPTCRIEFTDASTYLVRATCICSTTLFKGDYQLFLNQAPLIHSNTTNISKQFSPVSIGCRARFGSVSTSVSRIYNSTALEKPDCRIAYSALRHDLCHVTCICDGDSEHSTFKIFVNHELVTETETATFPSSCLRAIIYCQVDNKTPSLLHHGSQWLYFVTGSSFTVFFVCILVSIFYCGRKIVKGRNSAYSIQNHQSLPSRDQDDLWMRPRYPTPPEMFSNLR